MGTNKTEMQSTISSADSTPKKGGLFDKLRRGGKKETIEQAAKSFADHLLVVEEKLSSMVQTKQGDLSTEKGREDYNRRALGRLETMAFHVEKVVELANEYSEDC